MASQRMSPAPEQGSSFALTPIGLHYSQGGSLTKLWTSCTRLQRYSAGAHALLDEAGICFIDGCTWGARAYLVVAHIPVIAIGGPEPLAARDGYHVGIHEAQGLNWCDTIVPAAEFSGSMGGQSWLGKRPLLLVLDCSSSARAGAAICVQHSNCQRKNLHQASAIP